MRRNTGMATATSDALADLRLRQLTSAALPVGAFAYSQGLEGAVESGWVGDAARAEEWIGGQLRYAVATLEIPVLKRLIAAFLVSDHAAALRWSGLLLAMRDTAELRTQERALACAWAALLGDLGVPGAGAWAECPQRTALRG